MTSRFPMRGRAMARSGAAAVRTEEGAGRPETDGPSFFLLPKRRKESSVKRAEPASPATRPATAARTVTGRPCSSQILAMRKTVKMRMHCSTIWERAGTCTFSFP